MDICIICGQEAATMLCMCSGQPQALHAQCVSQHYTDFPGASHWTVPMFWLKADQNILEKLQPVTSGVSKIQRQVESERNFLRQIQEYADEVNSQIDATKATIVESMELVQEKFNDKVARIKQDIEKTLELIESDQLSDLEKYIATEALPLPEVDLDKPMDKLLKSLRQKCDVKRRTASHSLENLRTDSRIVEKDTLVIQNSPSDENDTQQSPEDEFDYFVFTQNLVG